MAGMSMPKKKIMKPMREALLALEKNDAINIHNDVHEVM
jgi:hypothetical protein